MAKETAIIVIDSGFSIESIRRAGRILAAFDLNRSSEEGIRVPLSELEEFAGDPLQHGSVVLDRLSARMPNVPFILIRAFTRGDHASLIRTAWLHGEIARNGWTEAYRQAVQFCREQGFYSVANCSFGGFTHAMDGTGWESHQLGREAGSGHLVVAAAGAGDGRALHASWSVLPDQTVVVRARQSGNTRYNLWAQKRRGCAGSRELRSWRMWVNRNGEHLFDQRGADVPDNLWNGRQQLTFEVEGAGDVYIGIRREVGAIACGAAHCACRFDCWITGDDSAAFVDHVDSTLVAEPAVFPHVLAVGLSALSYAPNQADAGAKPDVLLPGVGPISFRTPEVTAAAAKLLAEHGGDADKVRSILGKYPDLK